MKLNIQAFGLSWGVLSGVTAFLLLLVSVATGYAKEGLEVVAAFYPWLSVTYVGAFLGLITGFLEGYIFGVLVAWLYNTFHGV